MITDSELADLTVEERAALLDRLQGGLPAPSNPEAAKARVRFLVTITTACVVLIPWTVLLAVSLPSHYTASHWDLTWVGFDVVLTGCLARTAWLAYRNRYEVAFSAVVTGTLLVCDAWFDVTTATGVELVGSIACAVLAELPLTVLLFYVAHLVVTLTPAENRPSARVGRGRLRRTPVHREQP